MSKPTHAVVCDFDGKFKVVEVSKIPFKTKGTSEFKANKIKEKLNA